MILDCVMERGNPADSSMAVLMASRAKGSCESTPTQLAMDGGFASRSNLKEIKQLGIQEVYFHKRRGISVSMMVAESRICKSLRNFRAGVEGVISFLKRCFGLRICEDKGWEGFQRYVWRAIISCNLLIMGRHGLGAT